MNAFLKKQNLRLPLPKHQGGFSVSWQKIVSGVLLFGLCIGGLYFFQSPIKNTFYLVTAPISKSLWQAGGSASSFFNPIFNATAINQENNNLKQENQQLLSQVIALQNAIAQAQALQSAMQNTKTDNVALVVVQTLSLDSTNDFLLINKGWQDGIAQNMPVISSTKVLYGKVVKVYQNFSQVELISSKNSVVDVKIQPQDSGVPILGAIKGAGSLSLYLDLVPSDVKISQHQTVTTSGQEGIFPKDLLIGKITAINKDDAKPFQTASIQPFFDAKNIDTLFIITNYLKK